MNGFTPWGAFLLGLYASLGAMVGLGIIEVGVSYYYRLTAQLRLRRARKAHARRTQ